MGCKLIINLCQFLKRFSKQHDEYEFYVFPKNVFFQIGQPGKRFYRY